MQKIVFLFITCVLVTGAHADIAFSNVSPVQFSLEPVISKERKIGDTRISGLLWGGVAVILAPSVEGGDLTPIVGFELGPEIRFYPFEKRIFCLSIYSGFAAMLVHYGGRHALETGTTETSEYRLNTGFTTGIKSSMKLKICRFLSYEPYFSLSVSAYQSFSYEDNEFLLPDIDNGNAFGMYLITIGNRVVFEL